jgi:hypothetical protein
MAIPDVGVFKGTNLEMFLLKINCSQMKLLNFENWLAVKNWGSF